MRMPSAEYFYSASLPTREERFTRRLPLFMMRQPAVRVPAAISLGGSGVRKIDRQSAFARFGLEVRDCREEAGRRVQVVTCEFPHQPLHNWGAAHTGPEFPRHPKRQRDNGQSDGDIS